MKKRPGPAPRLDPIRRAAAEILLTWRQERRHVDRILADTERGLEARGLSDADRRRLRELVFGVVRLQGRYASLVTRHQRKPQRLKPEVEVTLWLALHELAEMETPAHAVVDQAVQLVRALRAAYAAGFVNAVLRAAAAAGVVEPEVEDPLDHAVHWLSHPRWLVERWNERLGATEMLALCRANNRRPRMTLRVAPGQREAVAQELRDLGIDPGGVAPPDAPDAIVLERGVPAPGLFERFGDRVVAQDLAAQRVAPLVTPPGGGRVLDMCAAPGGKSTHLAQRLAGHGRVVATDRSAARLQTLAAAARRLGLSNLDLAVVDGTDPAWAPASFDAVLLDAPCTGSGVLSRRHEARWTRTPQDLVELPHLQRLLLQSALDAVRPGGVVVYATCSLEPEENDQVVDDVLRSRDDVEERKVQDPALETMLRDGRYEVWPHRHGADGAFAARLAKKAI